MATPTITETSVDTLSDARKDVTSIYLQGTQVLEVNASVGYQSSVMTTKDIIRQVLDWDDLPRWMQIDPYIRRGYRRELNSFYACLRSLFYLHNELINTWSHLIPALVYLAMLMGFDVRIFRYDLKGSTTRLADWTTIQIYVVGTMICLGLSVSDYFESDWVYDDG